MRIAEQRIVGCIATLEVFEKVGWDDRDNATVDNGSGTSAFGRLRTYCGVRFRPIADVDGALAGIHTLKSVKVLAICWDTDRGRSDVP